MSTRRRARVIEVTEDELRQHLEHGAHEQRGDVRVEVDLQLEIPLPSWDEVRRVYTRNISRGGLMFRVQSPVTLPASARIVLRVPDDRTITLNSEIRHVARIEGTSEVEVGVQFKAVPPDVEEVLGAALAEASTAR